MKNKQSISDTICPHCHANAGRKLVGSISTSGNNSGPSIVCCGCEKEIKAFW